MAWQVNGTPITLTVSGNTMTVLDLTPLTFNFILVNSIDSGAVGCLFTVNADANPVYSRRQSLNGGTEFTNAGETAWNYSIETQGNGKLFVGYYCDIGDENKLLIMPGVDGDTVGVGTTPTRKEYVGKFVPIIEQGTIRFDANNNQAGDFDIGSNLSLFGTN